MVPSKTPIKFLQRSDYEKRLFLEKFIAIQHRVLAKKNYEIGVLTSERDEARFETKQAKKVIKVLQGG